MEEGRCRGREWRGKEQKRKIGMHEKIATKCNRFGIWGRPLGATAPCNTFLESSFQGQHSIADTTPLS